MIFNFVKKQLKSGLAITFEYVTVGAYRNVAHNFQDKLFDILSQNTLNRTRFGILHYNLILKTNGQRIGVGHRSGWIIILDESHFPTRVNARIQPKHSRYSPPLPRLATFFTSNNSLFFVSSPHCLLR